MAKTINKVPIISRENSEGVRQAIDQRQYKLIVNFGATESNIECLICSSNFSFLETCFSRKYMYWLYSWDKLHKKQTKAMLLASWTIEGHQYIFLIFEKFVVKLIMYAECMNMKIVKSKFITAKLEMKKTSSFGK